MKVAVVGVTGMVGQIVLRVLEENGLSITKLIPVASSKSIGKSIEYCGQKLTVVGMEEALLEQPNLAIFSAGGATSLEWAPKFAACGTTVIDNSSAWRMDPSKKLIVPEINGHLLDKSDKIIPNPNCSTIQLVLVLKPLHDKYGVKRVVVSTYQSITGTGVKAVKQMENERSNTKGDMAYPYEIDKNCIPQCDVFMDNGYTKEEMKLTNETKKILDSTIDVTATAVRVPVVGGHSEAVNIEFETEFEIDEVKKLLSDMPGLTLSDNPLNNEYPMPITAEGKNDVFVGRIRRDESQEKSLNLWIVADNLRKGAATNAVQIAAYVAQL
ncbi:aspartate-semialdehyde dehydrogenase [Crocinitomicaceae bacterium]|nr:aspartate-semialdehyde dehydrogenase [Crocinitomicaceae bacterium]MDC1203403.1 aspartate-semialdehyde dehydrogenase [Crocinitomicaceae bacterium]MDC1245136.1 aspartate-semialdehyde dehydrogenase [Crocinitomicaceae bacterium]